MVHFYTPCGCFSLMAIFTQRSTMNTMGHNEASMRTTVLDAFISNETDFTEDDCLVQRYAGNIQ